MTNLITVTNCETGETIEREMNADELAHFNLIKEEQAQQEADAEAKATAKQNILDRLGLTADEAAILLG
jgi:hypothetical protein